MRESQKKIVLSFAQIVVIIFVVITILCIYIAKIFNVKQESNVIFDWDETLSSARYSYNVILRSEDDELENILKLGNFERNTEILKLFKLTMNISEDKKLENYKYRFLNGTSVSADTKYYVKNFMISNDRKMLIGLNWTNPKCLQTNDLCGVMIFDMNGTKTPNRFGLDVFGVNIYKDRLDPFGTDLSYQENEKNCRRFESGVTCSRFYLIGGQFFK